MVLKAHAQRGRLVVIERLHAQVLHAYGVRQQKAVGVPHGRAPAKAVDARVVRQLAAQNASVSFFSKNACWRRSSSRRAFSSAPSQRAAAVPTTAVSSTRRMNSSWRTRSAEMRDTAPAALREHLYKPFVRQARQRVAHGRAADAEALRQRIFAQRLAGLVIRPEDRIPQPAVQIRPRGASLPGRSFPLPHQLCPSLPGPHRRALRGAGYWPCSKNIIFYSQNQ